MTHDAAAVAASGPAGESPPGPVPLPADLAEAAGALFGDRLPLAETFAELLATDGVVRGLIGPREAPRIWDRHLLNCAAVAELIPEDASVVDVGSGAGLPGLVLAVARPDLTMVLVEPLARRTAFLSEVVTRLGLDQSVTVVRGRAEELVGDQLAPSDVVTARAVAPLDRLAGWCLPLTAVGGRVLALKGSSAPAEVAEHQSAIDRLGGGAAVIRQCGVDLIEPPTTVVEIVREHVVAPGRSKPPARSTPRSKSERGAERDRSRRR